MKTSEEWNQVFTGICANDPAVHGQMLPNPQMRAFIERVQLDAQREGIRMAAEVAGGNELACIECCRFIKNAILAAAEQLKGEA